MPAADIKLPNVTELVLVNRGDMLDVPCGGDKP